MTSSSRAPSAPIIKRWLHMPSLVFRQLWLRKSASLCVLFIVTFVAYFYAADLKGLWNDDAVRLTMANGGLAEARIEARHPKGTQAVLAAIGPYAPQPLYLLLVNRILRLTRSYSVIPVVTTNLFIFLLSAIGIHLLARRLLHRGPGLLALFLYLWNGFAMVHVLQVREYSLILCFLVFNTLFFHTLAGPADIRSRTRVWLVAAAYCATCVGAFYTTKWAPLFLWPEAVIALLMLRRHFRRALVLLGVLFVASVACLPSVLSTPRNSVVFTIWDKQTPTLTLLVARLYEGSQYLLIGRHLQGFGLLQFYYWILLCVLIIGFVMICGRFFRERAEVQHLALTTIGFLAFQIGFFFFREPLSTWPRYFILYLPYVVLLTAITVSRLAQRPIRRASLRAWVMLIALLMVASSGFAQIRSNYRDPYIDHGPDFREVYRYLISRVAPADEIVVGLITNRMALAYYWPTPDQLHLRFQVTPLEKKQRYPGIWTVCYRDEQSPGYQAYVAELAGLKYRLTTSKVISGVTVRSYQIGR